MLHSATLQPPVLYFYQHSNTTHLPANRFDKEEQDMFTASVGSRRKIGVGKQAIEEALSACLIASDQCLATTLLPTVAVSRRRRPLEAAVVPAVANPSTFGAAAQRIHQTTGAALEDILTDVVGTGPSEGARIVVTQHVQWRVVRRRT